MAESDNLELKKRSRRRLVGAAALALVAAIILPMVMDEEPGLPAQDIQVTIPDRQADSLLARPIAGRPIGADDLQVAPAPIEQPPLQGETWIEDQSEERDGLDESLSTQDQRNLTPVLPPVTAGESSPPDRSSVVPLTTPGVAATPSPEEEAARVRAILEGRAAAGVSQSFFVQVGAFSEANKASSLSEDLKRQGFAAFTEAAGNVTRVRIGPFPSRNDAQQAVQRLNTIGIDGVVAAR